MNYTVRILPLAKNDWLSIFNYIAERSPQGARSWEAAYEQALTRLEQNPLICGFAPENHHFDFDLRQILFHTRRGKRYRMVFRVDQNVVTIYRIRGPGQAPLASGDL